MKKNAQSSLEFLIILGIGLFIIVLFGVLFFSYTNSAKSALDRQQLDIVANRLISEIEKIYFLGDGNRVTLNLAFPNGIENFSIIHMNISNGTDFIQLDYLNFTYFVEGGGKNSDLYFTKEHYIRFNCSNSCTQTANINGNWTSNFNGSYFSSGVKQIRLQSRGEYVEINFLLE